MPANATLTFAYELRSARVGELSDEAMPEAYDLCGDHADRTKPPYGWSLTDERPDEPLQPGQRPRDLGSDRTVAVLAAALRGDPGVEEDLLAMPDEDLPDPDDAADQALAELTDLSTIEPAVETLDATAEPIRPAPAPAPAPGWQVPAARD
jgi:hypothetical protein